MNKYAEKKKLIYNRRYDKIEHEEYLREKEKEMLTDTSVTTFYFKHGEEDTDLYDELKALVLASNINIEIFYPILSEFMKELAIATDNLNDYVKKYGEE